MNTEYDRLMREYQIPAGTLTAEELKLLHQGGIKIDDSDDEGDYDRSFNFNRQTQPKNGANKAAASEFEAYKQIYENQLSKKQKQIWYLQNQTAHRQKVWDAEKRRIQQQYQIQLEKVLAQLRRARAQIIHSEGQIPLIKEAINRIKQMLSGMESESVYLRLKDIPDRELPPSEWLLINVWQLIYPYKKELDYSKKETIKLRDEIKFMNDKQHNLLNQLDHYQRLLNSKDDDGKRHALNYDNNRKCLELEIDKLREQCQLLRQKGARYDELFRDYQFTKQQKQLLEEKVGFYDRAAQKDTTGTGKMGHEEAQRRKLDLLTQDKEYLTKQNIELIEKNRRYEDRLDRLEAELLSEKNRSQDLFGKILSMTESNASMTEQKILRQVSELKDKHQYQLQMAKNNLVDIYEKQIRFLKEAIDQKQLKNQTMDRQLREKSRQNEQLIIDSRQLHRKFDSDLSEARLSLKIKSEQLQRVNHIYQETLGNLNAHKLDNQMLREKLNCLKGEFYKQEANNKDQLSSLKAQVAVLREQLANYQLIQKEIDQAVLSLGQLNPNNAQIFTNTITSVPSSSKRRVQQALGLAQRLTAKQKEHEQTIQELRRKEIALQKAQEQLKIARSLLDKTNQPYSYLVNNIEDREKQIMNLRRQNKRLDQDYQNMREEYMVMSRQLQEAEKDVQRLLLKRQSIQNIQRILVDLTRGPTTSQQISGAIQQIRQILGSTQNQGQKITIGESRKGGTDSVPSWYKKLVDKRKG